MFELVKHAIKVDDKHLYIVHELLLVKQTSIHMATQGIADAVADQRNLHMICPLKTEFTWIVYEGSARAAQ
jgi:hypothetical protein